MLLKILHKHFPPSVILQLSQGVFQKRHENEVQRKYKIEVESMLEKSYLWYLGREWTIGSCIVFAMARSHRGEVKTKRRPREYMRMSKQN